MEFSFSSADRGVWAGYLEPWLALAVLGLIPAYVWARLRLWASEL